MTDDRSSDVLGALPRTRPHRRSDKRPARPDAPSPDVEAPSPGAKAPATRAKTATARRAAKQPARPATKRLPQPPQPTGTPAGAPAQRSHQAPSSVPILSTAVQAVGELAEIGVTLGARALRGAVSRLPRP